MADQETRNELNRLYWDSDESVAGIADRLGISRRALYEDLEPLPAGARCPDCDAALGYRNRTAAENREAECPACGREVQLDPAGAGPAPGAEPEAGDEGLDTPALEQERSAAPLSPARAVPPAGSGPILGMVLLVGIGLGALVAYLLRRG